MIRDYPEDERLIREIEALKAEAEEHLEYVERTLRGLRALRVQAEGVAPPRRGRRPDAPGPWLAAGSGAGG